ncbi:MAG: carboxypeptidase-like regulatory domain-containing protein [Deferrisomatales bacterium]|nr:carboxypeptidase-like regulatory domain-containing protein [Deferrisomatales bacterium]
MHRAPALLSLLALLGCTSPEPPGSVTGTVAWQGKPVAMALVEAYPKPERDPATPPVGETPSAADGTFSLDLPPGQYWVWARATVAGESRELRLVGQATGNPVRVRSGAAAVENVALRDATGFAAATGPAGTGVHGTVLGAPPPQVTIYAYSGRSVRPLGPGFAAAVPAGPGGRFRLDLAPGEYTLAARWRASGADHGALAPGDRVAVAVVTVAGGGYAEAGPMELRTLDAEVWRAVETRGAVTETWIAGRVTDPAGNPKAAIRVLAFDDPRMAGKPLALSAATGGDGAFRVYLPGAGRYFLGARSRIGGPAEPGEWTGTYRGEDGSGVSVAQGERRDGVEIPLEEVW